MNFRTLLGKATAYLELGAGPQRASAPVRRSYQAARRNRLTADWLSHPTSANYEMRYSLRVLRARSRDLARNNAYVKKFLSMVRTNVVGAQGIKLQVRATDTRGQLDAALNKQVERAFSEWTNPETASATGRLSWVDAQRLFVSTLARDGEVLVRLIDADNPFGLALKFYDVNWLDETYNEVLPDGRRIIMSVEVDAMDRPVAYWLTPPPADYPYGWANTIRRRTRVPADEIIHRFLVHDDDTQVRGVPWGHTAMLDLHNLAGYTNAEITAARVGASKMGFIIPPEEDEFAGEANENASAPELLDNVEPGVISELPPGYDFKPFDPQHPATNVGAFIKVILRAVAAGLDVSYFTLANDLEGVNYSSARIGLLDERDVWRSLQSWMIQHFCRPVFLRWLKGAMVSGALPQLKARDFDRLKAPLWRPRGWTWIDPEKDIKAHILAIDNALETRTDVVAEGGGDFDELTTTLELEQKTLAGKKIRLPEANASAKRPAKADAEATEEEEE